MKAEAMTDAELALRPHRVRGVVAPALLEARAIREADAARYVPGTPNAARELERLRDAGVVRATRDGRVWYDLRRHYAVEAARRRLQVPIAIVVCVIVAVLATFAYQG